MTSDFVPPEHYERPAIVVAAAPVQREKVRKVAGSCILNPKNVEGGLLPAYVATMYYSQYEHRDIGTIRASKITILKAPQHGSLTFSAFSEQSSDPHYIYKPKPGFVGEDTVEFSVSIDSDALRIVQTVVVYDGVASSSREGALCPHGGLWNMSSHHNAP